jgi:hypothetical protein
VQSAFDTQFRNDSIEHTVSKGPAAQTPSPAPTSRQLIPGASGFSLQRFGWVGSPGRPQPPAGHCEATLHGAHVGAGGAATPPQMPGLPPLGGQSALLAHGSAFALLQVSQKQASDVNPV